VETAPRSRAGRWRRIRAGPVARGIFSRLPAGVLPKTWVRVEDRHAAFARTGLKKTSVLKTEKIAVVHRSVFHRKLGILPPDLMAQGQTALKRALLLP